MTGTLDVYVPGLPKPKGSTRAFVIKGTNRAVTTDSGGAPLKAWASACSGAIADAMGGPLWAGPVSVTLVFYLPRPASHPKTRTTWPTTRPDIDKLARAVLDAMTAVVFADDGQVTELYTAKKWAPAEHGPGVRIRASAHAPST